MTIRHQQGKALHSTLNTVALIAITVYLWYAGPQKPAIPPDDALPSLSAPQPAADAQMFIPDRVIGVTDGDTVTVRDETKTQHKIPLDEPLDPNSWLEFIMDRSISDSNSLREFLDGLKPAPRILPFIEKTPETKESNVHANENRTKVPPRQLSVSQQEQDSAIPG